MRVSGIVVTKNEENNIQDCLESLKWVDEIIIVDSNSGDKTAEIAKQYTSKIYTVDFESVAEKRKFSLDKSSCEWVLFLDADERVSDELRNEIVSLKENTNIEGYYINRKNFYLGKWIKHCGLYPDFHLRLFKRDKAQITDRVVHESIEINGKSEKLKHDILHYSCNDLYQMMNKINYYSTLEAEEHFQKNKQITKAGAFAHSISAFLRMFISRKGYKDNLYGFYVSISDALTNFLTHLKLLKLQNRI
jgi:glycosyltransferase involved in cell wall biosynthesis